MSLRGADFDTQLLYNVDAIANEEQDQLIGDGNQEMCGSGGTLTLYIWVTIGVGVAVLAFILCFIACRCQDKEKKVAQDDDDKALDQPLIA